MSYDFHATVCNSYMNCSSDINGTMLSDCTLTAIAINVLISLLFQQLITLQSVNNS